MSFPSVSSSHPRGIPFGGRTMPKMPARGALTRISPAHLPPLHVFWAGLLGQLPPPWEKEAFFAPFLFCLPKNGIFFWPTGFLGGRVGRRLFLSFSDSGPNIDSVRIANWIAFRPFLSGIKIVLCRTRFFPLVLQKGNIWVAPGINHLQREWGRKEPPGYDFLPLLGKGVIYLSRETRGFLHMQHGVARCSTENKCSSLAKDRNSPGAARK